MIAGDAVAQLVAQHEELWAIMDRCEELADDLDVDRGSPAQLMREVARLRIAFDEHNRFEEQVLRPIFRAAGVFGAVRERMVTDHIGEHHALRDRLATGPAAELRATIATMREHLAAEERHLLSTSQSGFPLAEPRG